MALGALSALEFQTVRGHVIHHFVVSFNFLSNGGLIFNAGFTISLTTNLFYNKKKMNQLILYYATNSICTNIQGDS
jgi:hypothetical protein